MSNGLAMVVFVSCTVFGVFQVHELREDWVRGLVQELEPIQKEVDARHAETSTPPPLASLGTLPRKVKGRTFTHDGEWGISIELPLALSFDSLIYLPSRRYPEVGFGGKVVPVGEWAYIHE